jgi:hypothetical protein
MNSEELIRQIVLQAKSEQYGRDRGWIVVKLPISDRDLSLYVKEAGDRGLVEVTNLTSLDSGYDEWKIRGITALGLRFLQHPTSETASDKHPEADKSAKIYFLVGSFVALLAWDFL